MRKNQNGAPYETPTLDVVLIEHADVITTSDDLIKDGDYDENGWT